RMQQGRKQVEAGAGRLESLSPLKVLARGYSLTRKEQNEAVVREAGQVQPGERLVTIVHRGRIVSRVEETASAEAASQRIAFPGPEVGIGGRTSTDGPFHE